MKNSQRNWVLLALMITMMLAAMNSTIVATAIPQIVGDLGGFSLFSWLFSIYLLVQTVTIPIYGKLADIYSRKPILIIGIIIFLFGSAACATSWNMNVLILFRGIQAVGAGAIMATVNTIAGDIYTVKERAKIQGWLSSVWGISAVIGPAIGGAIVDNISWRWIFLINLPVGILAISLISVHLAERKIHNIHKIDWMGAITVLIAGSALLFGLLQGGQSWPWISVQSLIILIITIVAGILVLKIERRAEEPILPGWVWKKRVLLGSNLGTIGMGITTMGVNMFIPVYAQSVHMVSATEAGFILAAMSITWPLFSSLSGNLYLKIGFRNTALLGMITVIFGASIFHFLPFQGPIWVLVLIQMVLGAGFGLTGTPLMVGVQSTVRWGQRGVVTGANMFSRYFGQSLGAAIFAAVFNSVLTSKIQNPPADLKSKLPAVNDVVSDLQSHKLTPDVNNYLQHGFFDAMEMVFLGMMLTGFVTVIILLMTPAKFPTLDENK
ncbi:MAG: MFS transporter [Flavobacteriia bacterium]|nr:MFS transporter [Flavobacteriia bacterium]